MSKKIAEGTGALVLDVKVGTGAFMKDRRRRPRAGRDDGRARHGRRRAHGRAAHRHVHPARAAPPATRSRCAESVEVLAGGGPADVVELTLALAREMLAGAGRDDVDPADRLRRRLGDGRLAGDDPRPGRRPRRRRCPTARESHVVAAPVVGRADPARRDGGRAGRLAARRRPRPQGGPGPGRRRRRAGTPARATRSPRGSRCSPCTPTSRSASSGPWRRSRAATTSRADGHGVRTRRRWCSDRIG